MQHAVIIIIFIRVISMGFNIVLKHLTIKENLTNEKYIIMYHINNFKYTMSILSLFVIVYMKYNYFWYYRPSIIDLFTKNKVTQT